MPFTYFLFSHHKMLLVSLRWHLYISKISLLFMFPNHSCFANFHLLFASLYISLNLGLDVNFFLSRTFVDAPLTIFLNDFHVSFTVLFFSHFFPFRVFLCFSYILLSLKLSILYFSFVNLQYIVFLYLPICIVSRKFKII